MGFGTQPVTAPVYNAPNLAPFLDFLLDNLPSDTFAALPSLTLASKCNYHPLLGERALFSPTNNITTTTRRTLLTDFSQYALAAEPANCGGAMPTKPVDGRYIYMPQGFSAALVRGSNFYRYDPWLDAWATMAAITTLNAAYRFDYNVGVIWGGGDYIYIFGGWDGTDNLNTFRYSITGDSWAQMADSPFAVSPYGGVEGPIGDYIYVLDGQSGGKLFRYSISGDSWTTLTAQGGWIAYAGMVQDLVTTDYLYVFNGYALTRALFRYSISGDSWTTLTATNLPAKSFAKGVFFSSPTPCVLIPSTTDSTLWVYKV